MTAFFSSSVSLLASTTWVFSGATSFIILSVSLASSIVCLGWNVPFLESVIGTVTVPLSSTWISSSVNPRSGLAFLISSLTACFSSSVSCAGFPTLTFLAGGFKVLPSLVNCFTVSLASNVPVLLPSLTVTLPLLSTSTFASVPKVSFASLTFLATSFFSSCVKISGFFTSTFSAGFFKSRIVSFWTTVLSGVIVPTLPLWFILTVPSASTVRSSSLKFLSGLASFTACLTCFISSSVNAFAFSTLTGSFGGLNLFSTNFWVTVFSFEIVPVLPSLFTVTVPSPETVISSFAKFRSGFAFITLSFILSFSSVDTALRSFTSTFSWGLFNFNGSSAFFSQTAYTVFGDVTPVNKLGFASVASFESAQPLKV